MNQLSVNAKKLDKVFEIVHIVLGALAVASAVFVVLIGITYVMGWSPEFIGTNYEAFDVGFLELEIAPGYAPDKWLVLFHAAFTLVVSCRLLYDSRKGVRYIREILKPMTEGKPFDSIVSINLKKLARLSIVLGILWNVINLSSQIVSIFVYGLPDLLVSEKILHVGAMFQVDLSFLICWAILLLLSYVFRYGEDLQALSDETL